MTYPQLSALVRQRLGAPVRDRLRFQSMVAPALNRLADKVALSPVNRHLLLTTRSTTLATLASGKSDLLGLISGAPFINLARIQCGTIYHSSSAYPLEWISNQTAALVANTDDSFGSIYLEGTILYTKTNNGVLTGNLQLVVPYVPLLYNLPDQLHDMLVDKVVELVMVPQGMPDVAEDGQK